MKIIAATRNKGKLAEMQAILTPLGFELIPQDQACPDLDIIEDGETFEQNAEKKARTIAQMTGLPALADDSGLLVDFLNGAPGIYTARYAGENATDLQNMEKLLKELADVPFYKRTAKFVCVMALVLPNGEAYSARGELQGYILTKIESGGGFGYDPIFLEARFDMPLSQMEPHIKNVISHRFKALVALMEAIGFGKDKKRRPKMDFQAPPLSTVI